MTKWAMVLAANEPYIPRALMSILQARTVGGWLDSIVLLMPLSATMDMQVKDVCDQMHVERLGLPYNDFADLFAFWEENREHENYQYIKTRNWLYMKFYIFHPWFKQWDRILYMDSGCSVQGSLERMKKVCVVPDCLYAHSDVYPYLEKRTFRSQFCMDLANEEMRGILDNYDLDADYFQTTFLVYDTSILSHETFLHLWKLSKGLPISRRMDQGITNLVFKDKWKQIPIKDSEGFLYDFSERSNFKKNDYVVLKYPHT